MSDSNNIVPTKVATSFLWSSFWPTALGVLAVQVILPVSFISCGLSFVLSLLIWIYAIKGALSKPHFGYKINVAGANNTIILLKIAASIFWSMYWRAIVFIFGFGALAGFLSVMSVRFHVLELVSAVLLLLLAVLCIPMLVYGMKIALSKKHFSHEISISKIETLPEGSAKL
ncbi:MAG: hypothetical protein WC521_06040 [Bdellovibrionales bacterium]|jgi:hypothetical protein